MKPTLVVVSGAPGSGKTELARSLSRTVGMPLLGKDMIKEPLMDALPVPDRERSMEVGRATFRLLFALSQAFLDADVGMIMEAPLTHAHSETDLRNLARRSSMVIIHCAPPPPVAVERYRARFLSGQRSRRPLRWFGRRDAGSEHRGWRLRAAGRWYGSPSRRYKRCLPTECCRRRRLGEAAGTDSWYVIASDPDRVNDSHRGLLAALTLMISTCASTRSAEVGVGH